MGRLADAWTALTSPATAEEIAARAAAIVGAALGIDTAKTAGTAGAVFGLETAKTDARGLLQGVMPWGIPPKRGTREAMMLYAASPWLRAVVGRISLRVASTRWRLFAVKGQDGKARRVRAFANAGPLTRRKLWRELRRKAADVVEIEEHPMLELLEAGNLVLDGRSSWQVSQAQWDIKGDVYWLLERHESGPLKGKPSQWWPVPSFWVQMTPTVSNPFFRFQYAGWQAQVPESEVLWARDPDPSNPYGRGIGIAESLSDELMSDEYSAKFINEWFYNRGLPATIVTFKGSKEEAERAQDIWRQKYAGVLKAFQVHFTNSDVDIKQLSQTFEQQQILGLRDQMKKNILQTFGYPGELLGDLSNANRSTIDTAAYRLEKYCVEPRREFWRHVLQNRIAPEYDERLIVEYDNDVPEDREFMLKGATARPSAFTNNEVREISGAEPTDEPWGDERPPTPTAAPAPGAGLDAGGLALSLTAELLRTKKMLRRQLKRHRDRDQLALPAAPQPTSEKAGSEDEDQQDDHSGPDWDPDDVPDPSKLISEQEIVEELAASMADAVKAFGEHAFGSALEASAEAGTDVSGAFSMTNPTVTGFLKSFAADDVGAITETTRAYLKDFLAQAYKDGDSIDDMVDALTDESNSGFGDARAELIARTEVLRASNFGTLAGYRQSGVVDKKIWIATPGTKGSRESHEDLDGTIIGIDEEFTDSATGATAQHPGGFGDPASDCNCRCAVSAWIDDPEDADGKALGTAKSKPKGRALHESHAHIEEMRAPHEKQLREASARVLAKQRGAVVAALHAARAARP